MSESEIKILQRIDRLSRDVRIIKAAIVDRPIKETWITGAELSAITGWDYKAKRLYRERGTIKFKKEQRTNGNRYLYLLSSIPNEFKKAV